MHNIINPLVRACLSLSQEDFYDALIKKIDDYFLNYNSKDNIVGFSNIKNKNKLKGNLFEYMCYQHLKLGSFSNIKVKDIWLFSDLPEDLRKRFNFTNKDMGIDIIVFTISGEWLAIQCKYKKKSNHSKTPNGMYIKHQVPWTALSTSYSLCESTG